MPSSLVRATAKLRATPRFKKAMVFGAFDGLHPGHVHFLKEAKKNAKFLVVVVAQDAAIFRLKGALPRFSLAKRMRTLRALEIAQKIIPGDIRRGSWRVIANEKPDLILVGYDQKELLRELRALASSGVHPFEIIRATPHRPRVFHSRILRKNGAARNRLSSLGSAGSRQSSR